MYFASDFSETPLSEGCYGFKSLFLISAPHYQFLLVVLSETTFILLNASFTRFELVKLVPFSSKLCLKSLSEGQDREGERVTVFK